MPLSKQNLSKTILTGARDLGFARAGITDIRQPARHGLYLQWIARQQHGSMRYMEDEFHKRARSDMRVLLPEALSAIVVALSYEKATVERAPHPPEAPPRGTVAQYALGDDYHHVMQEKLRALAASIDLHSGTTHASRVCVDSAPLLERELAERSGLGFIGKNTMLITPGLGSYTLLGVLLSSANLDPSEIESEHDCGSCTACLQACPTQAFVGPYNLDARRCISYLTIESEEAIPESLREAMGDRIFGCDVCQDVCPYNARAPLRVKIIPEMRPREAERSRPSLDHLASLGSNQRKKYVAGSPLRRNRREQMLRNVAVALGNVDPCSDTLTTLSCDRNPMVQEHADWALSRGTSDIEAER